MTKNTALPVLFFLGIALGLSACGPVAPVSPTWNDDVRPLMVARCIRCHDDPGRKDFEVTTPGVNMAVLAGFNFNLRTIADVMASPAYPFLIRSAEFARHTDTLRMPPLPAETLEDWQIDMLATWAFHPL
jgi:hypothetical protein